MPEPQPFIVGRQSEVDHFAALVEGRSAHWLLNVYGPGGIGKTVVCQKLIAYARQAQFPHAAVDGYRPDLTPDRILYAVKEGLATNERLADAFNAFEQQFQEYLIVQDILQRGGGVQAMFDVVGNVKDRAGFAQLLGSIGKTVTESVHHTVGNRFALERYLRGVEKILTASLCDSVGAALEQAGKPVALLLDTYEEMEGLDDWVCRTFVPKLPDGVKIVVFGRNALPKVNFDWDEFGQSLHVMELPELPEADAKHYLEHHGLRDVVALDQVYRFIGGYPLLLVLVVHLAREAGGWDKIGALESEADRDRVATKLLERILREERAREVRAFLEKGVIARWFNAEIIGVILEVSLDEARSIYDKLQRHSFVERHPYGLKFHDKIRDLLVDRLKFTSSAEYQRLTKRLMAYYAEKAGIEHTNLEEDTEQAQGMFRPESSTAKKAVLFPQHPAKSENISRSIETNRLPAKSSSTPYPDTVDLAIVTAMPEELEPVLGLIGGREHWRPFLLDRFVHHHSHFEIGSESLSVVACSLWKYGGNPTTAEILRLKPLRPRLIAMTGICAGWESKAIHFGDVIIADRAFHAGEGKETARGFEPDMRTYQPPPWLLQWLGDFSKDQQWFKEMRTPRPHSLRYQAEWVLCQMAERNGPYPETAADWRKVKANRIDFPRVRQLLLENGLISGEGLLTEPALVTLNELRHKNHGKLIPVRDPKRPSAHYGAFASTEAIIAVENPFLEHAKRIRKVRAIELEVASLFSAAAEIGVPAFAVKGVSDYGTPEKDDAFHNYAAEAAARWMYQFIRTYGHLLFSL